MHIVNPLSNEAILFDSLNYSCSYRTPINNKGHRINKYCDIYGPDWSFMVRRYDRDRTLNQMRRDLYNHTYNDVYARSLKDRGYSENRKELKNVNSELNQLIYDHKKCKLMDLVQKYVFEERWSKIPSSLKLDVTNARMVGNYDGNAKTLLAEDDKYFYVAHHSGS